MMRDSPHDADDLQVHAKADLTPSPIPPDTDTPSVDAWDGLDTPLLPPPSPYMLRIALKLDGELVEERFTEPGERVTIGHDPRANTLCWPKLPRRLTLLTYSSSGEPSLLVQPRWRVRVAPSPQSPYRPVHLHTPPETLAILPLIPASLIEIDLDGGTTLHVEHLPDALYAMPALHAAEQRATPPVAAKHLILIAPLSSLVASLCIALIASASAPAPPLASPNAPRQQAQQNLSPALSLDPPPLRLAGASPGELSYLSAQERLALSHFTAHPERYKDCHERAARQEPSISGVATFSVVITPRGDRSVVERVHLVERSVPAALADCLAERLRHTTLPFTSAPLTLPLHFSFSR